MRPGESAEDYRHPCRKDYARVIHCPSFRRLQGKTQLFPGYESDFFRNRLTHSLEVAQVAESIAYKLNHEHPYFKRSDQTKLKPRLCSTAALVHDIGHPPFGHNGEHALDDKMKEYGGFEGNAQTLRIISRLEKKRLLNPEQLEEDDQGDQRVGLNLTYRTLAAALKYDREIEHVRGPEDGLTKGYYAVDACKVRRIKTAVEPDWESSGQPFKTIECGIMDIADDIAYSTYDLEDSLKAGFLTPADILASDEELLSKVAEKVARATGDEHFSSADILSIFWDMFAGLAKNPEDKEGPEDDLYTIVSAFDRSKKIASDGYLRTDFTAELVGEFIAGVEVDVDEERPALSKAYLRPDVKKRVETLKNYTYEATIFSTRLKVAEFRGYEVVANIVDALSDSKGYLLMPDDTRRLFKSVESNATARMRVICDFVAGMTDRYALEFYGRLHSDSPQSIFKPI